MAQGLLFLLNNAASFGLLSFASGDTYFRHDPSFKVLLEYSEDLLSLRLELLNLVIRHLSLVGCSSTLSTLS